MNQKVSNLIHAFVHQEANKAGQFTTKRRYTRNGELNASFDGSTFFHYGAPVGYLLHPQKKGRPVVLFHTDIKSVERNCWYVEGCVSSKTTKEVCAMLRRAVDTQVPISIPGVVRDGSFHGDAENDAPPEAIACYHGARINKFLKEEGAHFRTAKDVEYLVRILDSARKLNKLYKRSVDQKLIDKVQHDMDAYYAKRKVAGVKCVSYADYSKKKKELSQMRFNCFQDLRGILHTLNRCEALYNYCLNAGGKIDHLVVRATEIIDNMRKLDKDFAISVNDTVDIYADGRYNELSRLIKEAKSTMYSDPMFDDGRGKLCKAVRALVPCRSMFTGMSEKAQIHYDKKGCRTITTSMGVTLDVDTTKAIHTVVEAILAGKNIAGRHVGPFVVREHDDTWLRVGCHKFRTSFAKKFCELYTLDQEAYESRKHELVGDWDGKGTSVADGMLKLVDDMQQVARDLFDENYKVGVSKAAASDAEAAGRELAEAKQNYSKARELYDNINKKFQEMYDEDGKRKCTA